MNTRSGVSTFVRHYVQVLGHAANTGDVKELQRLSAKECEGCTRYIGLFRDTYEAGGLLRQNWSAPNDSVVRHDPRVDASSFVTTDLKISRGMYKQSAGEPTTKIKATSTRVTFALRFDDGWIVTQFGSGGYE